MSDERDVRELLAAEANRAPEPHGLKAHTVRSARRRRSALIASSLLGGLILVGGAVSAAVVLDDGDPAPAIEEPTEDPTGGGQVAFARYSSPDVGLYVMNSDGANLRRIFDGTVDDPVWSPDGTRIAFNGYLDTARCVAGAGARCDGAGKAGELLIATAHGTDPTPFGESGSQPSWSPDGRRIAYANGRDGSIRIAGVDGSDPQLLAERGTEPAWSPDGTRLAFVTNNEIHVAALDGSEELVLGAHLVDDRPIGLSWSPDSKLLAFTTWEGDGPSGSITVMNANGSGTRTVTQGQIPTFSPDGTRIAFERLTGDVSHIYSVALDGSDLQQLTSGPGSDHSPSWTAATPSDQPPHCPTIGEGEYELTLAYPSGVSGTAMRATGPIPMYGEDGNYNPPDPDAAIHFWFGADEDRWEELIGPDGEPDTEPGDGVRYLGFQGISDPSHCFFAHGFEIPDVAAGHHSVVAVIFDGDGAAPYDSATFEVTGSNVQAHPVGQFPRSIDVGEGYVWAVVEEPDFGTGLKRLGPDGESPDSLQIPQAGDVAAGAGAVWVTSLQDDVGSAIVRVDPETNGIDAVIPIDCADSDCSAVNIAADESSVWATVVYDSGRGGDVVRIDPTSNEIVARIPVEDGPRDIVLGGGSVWVNMLSRVRGDTVMGGSLVRIDPEQNAVTDVLLQDQMSVGGDEFPPVLTADDYYVWAVTQRSNGPTEEADILLVQIDAVTGDILYRSGNLVPEGVGPSVYPFAVDGDAVWFYGGSEVAVHKLNSGGRVLQSTSVREHTYNVVDAVRDPETGAIWVASYEGPLIRIDPH